MNNAFATAHKFASIARDIARTTWCGDFDYTATFRWALGEIYAGRELPCLEAPVEFEVSSDGEFALVDDMTSRSAVESVMTREVARNLYRTLVDAGYTVPKSSADDLDEDVIEHDGEEDADIGWGSVC